LFSTALIAWVVILPLMILVAGELGSRYAEWRRARRRSTGIFVDVEASSLESTRRAAR